MGTPPAPSEAPCFQPTAEEWADPMAYLSWVRCQAEPYGVAKIVPPQGWAPPLAFDRRRKLPTKLLSVHQLQSRDTSAATKHFYDAYNAFMESNGTRPKKKPTLMGQELDLYQLYRLVTKKGGYNAVTEERGWKDIMAALQIPDKSGNVSYQLKAHYQRLLLAYEDHCRAQTGGEGIHVAAMEEDDPESGSEEAAAQEDMIDDDEAAEILEAMLGLAPPVAAPEPTRKRRRGATRDGSAPPQSGMKVPENIFTMVCEKCKGGHLEERMIICDRCDKGWHTFCLSPPLESVPEGEWVCPACVVTELEGDAVRRGETYTLDEIELIASTFERQWFGSDEAAAAVGPADREAEFWRVVEEGEDVAEVLLAAGLDAAVHGSGFPLPEGPDGAAAVAAAAPYANNPWNLAAGLRAAGAAGEHGNLLALAPGGLSGVTSPSIWATMLFAAVPWRTQPHQLYGLSYLHYGGPVRHYVVPAHAAALLEAAALGALPPQIARRPEALQALHALLSPQALAAAGIPVTALIQEPGTFVVTFPNSYAASVALGTGLAETVAAAPPDWLRYGAMSVSRQRSFRVPAALSLERLLVAAADAAVAAPPHLPPRAAYWVARELRRVASEERVLRAKLWSEGLVRSRCVGQAVGLDYGDESDAACAVCAAPLHLSAVECDCCPGRRVCLHHAGALCECAPGRRRLAWRHTLQELDAKAAAAAALASPEVADKIEAEEAEAAARVDAAAQAASAAVAAAAAAKAAAAAANGVKKEAEEKEGGGAGAAAAAGASAPLLKTEEPDDLEGLAGFMTMMGAVQGADEEEAKAEAGAAALAGRKRKRSDADAADADAAAAPAPPGSLTLVVGNGFVQGPVRPFQTLDVYPEDRDAAPEWLASLDAKCNGWQRRARAALEQGGPLAADLASLVAEAEQYAWGGVSPAAAAAVAELQPRLADAEDFMAAVDAALQGKPPLEAVDALLRQEPKPLAHPPGLDVLAEAAEAARGWLARCAHLAAPDAPPVDARILETAVNEAARLPLALPEARALRERLAAARRVADAIRAALPSAREAGRRKKDEVATTLDHLQGLAAAAAAARVDLPEAANLAAVLERIEAWQERVDELTAGPRVSLVALRELLEEAESLPAALADVAQLRTVVDRADSWVRHTESLVVGRAPLKKLRDQLHTGQRLAVAVAEVDDLRQDIRRREWEDTARKVANAKGTLHALMEVLSSAAEAGAEASPLAAALQAKVDDAARWERRAAGFMARYGGAPGGPEAQRPSIAEVESMVGEGAATGVRMERLSTLTAALHAAKKWLTRAQECLPAAAQAELAERQQAGEADGGAEPMDTAPSTDASGGIDPVLALVMTTAAAQAEGGEGSAGAADATPDAGGGGDEEDRHAVAAIPKPRGRGRKKVVIDPGAAPPYATLSSLLEEYDERLVVRAAEAAPLRELRSKADFWLEEARPVLEQEFVTDDQLPLLRDLIAGGKATGVAMEQVDILEANVEALLWAQGVRELLERLPPLPAELKPPLPPEASEGEGEGAEEGADGAKEDAPAPVLSTGVPPPDADPSASDDERPLPTTPFDQRPPLAQLMRLLEEGSILPCDEELFGRFRRYVEAGEAWERAARSVLAIGKDGGPARLVGVRPLRKLIARGERLGLGVPALPRLHEVVRAHDRWEARVRDLMATAGARPAYGELQVFQQTARLSPVTSNLRRHIDAAVGAVGAWAETTRRTIAKRNTGMRLDRCFDVVVHSIDCAVDQFERRLEAEKRMVAAAAPRRAPGDGGAEEDERELYCLCQQPYNVDTSMISCDLCREWYHSRCVGVTQTQARSLRKYTCPICAAVRNVMDPMEYALGKLRRTRRPTRAELGELLTEVKTLPASVEEEATLERLLVKYDRWATATNRAVEVHEASRRTSAGGQVLPLSDAMLHQLCKSALALEVDATEHAERILHLLRCNRWRGRVDAVLSAAAGAKASAEAVAKLLTEAERLEVDAPNDIAGSRLLAAAAAAKKWQEEVTECVAALKGAGGGGDPAFEAEVARAQKLIAAAEALPIRVDRELETLKEYAKPYCLCRRPYDDQIPMLECDRCSEWFHFACVGLKGEKKEGEGGEGGEGDGEGEPAPPETFSCPICCMRSGTKYPYFHRLPEASLDALKEAAAAMPAPAPPAAPAAAAAPAATAQQQAQAQAAAVAAQMAMYPQAAWPYAAMAAAQQAQRGTATATGASNPQALASMMEAAAAQFPQGVAMVPGMVHPAAAAMFGFAGMHPAMAQAAMAQAAAAQAAAAQQAQAQAAAQQQAAAAQQQQVAAAQAAQQQQTAAAQAAQQQEAAKQQPAKGKKKSKGKVDAAGGDPEAESIDIVS